MKEGGVETVVRNLCRALKGRGHESLVIARSGGDIALDLKSKNPLTFFFRAWRLRSVLRRERPDLVCTHSRVPAWLFVWANRKLSLKWITYAHGANSVSRYSSVMTRGERVIAPSNFLAGYLRANYRFDQTKVRVIPNAVDLERFDPARLDAEFMAEKRREWGIAEGDFVSMAIGRISPVKGLERLIAGPRRGKFVIVGGADRGKESYLESLRALARKHPGVIFAGHKTKIAECIALADEIVIGNTVKPESFGLSAAEAYAMNRPVRALKRFGGIKEVMDSVEGLVHSRAVADYRAAIARLYDFEKMAAKTLTIYMEVAR